MQSPVSDSIDISDVHSLATKQRTAGWIDAVQQYKTPTTGVQPKSVTPYTANTAKETTVNESPIPVDQGDRSLMNGSSSVVLKSTPSVVAPSSPYGNNQEDSPHPRANTTYSSSLMQALSMTEGALAKKEVKPRSVRAQSAPLRASSQLYEEGMRAKLAKQQWVSVEQTRQQQLKEALVKRECSFRPQISKYAKGIRRPSSLRPENRAGAEVLRKKQWCAMKAREQAERELDECTFRPLTLAIVNLEPDALKNKKGRIHDVLYREAQQRREFQETIAPKLVEKMEKAVRVGGAENKYTEQDIESIVTRMVSRAAVRKEAAPVETGLFQPTISSASKRIVEEKVFLGERNPNIVDRLYRPPTTEVEVNIEAMIEEKKKVIAQELFQLQLQEEQYRLELDYKRGIILEKFRALSKKACLTRGEVYYPDKPQYVIGLARASLDVLTSDESEELLNILEQSDDLYVSADTFVRWVLSYVERQKDQDETYRSPLIELTPSSFRPRTAPPKKTKELPIVQREVADPKVLENVRKKREEEMMRYKESRKAREEMARRSPFHFTPLKHSPSHTRAVQMFTYQLKPPERINFVGCRHYSECRRHQLQSPWRRQKVTPSAPSKKPFGSSYQSTALSHVPSLSEKEETGTETRSPPPKEVDTGLQFARTDASRPVLVEEAKPASRAASSKSTVSLEAKKQDPYRELHSARASGQTGSVDLVRLGQELLLKQLREHQTAEEAKSLKMELVQAVFFCFWCRIFLFFGVIHSVL